MNRLSACIITLNEQDRLGRALASLAGVADEIIVVDCGSSDRTVEIAREAGAICFLRAWSGYAEQKNFAAERASNEWLLSMDADEALSEPLRESLRRWKEKKPAHSVYEVARRAWYLGAWIKHSGWYPDFQRRLYRRDEMKFSGVVHESLSVHIKADGERGRGVGRIDGDLLHYSVQSVEEHEAKVERYTTLAARQLYEAGERHWRAAVYLATPWSWFQNFVLRGGFLDGRRGSLIARMAARSVRLKYLKLGRLVSTSTVRDSN
ncbi:MAG: glycosyltransferase family 2 protein [Candidatus Acidiferrum sp.]